MAEFGEDLVIACRNAIARVRKRRQTAHPQLYPQSCEALIRRLQAWCAANGSTRSVPRDVLDQLVESVDAGDASAAGQHYKHKKEVRKSIVDYYCLLQVEDKDFRLSRRSDLANDAMLSGEDVISATGDAHVAHYLAHNHFLAFPESFKVFDVLDRQGRPANVLTDLAELFHFGRKINSVTAEFIRQELLQYRVLRERNGLLSVQHVPASAVAYLVAETYLRYTDYKIDRGLGTSEILSTLENFFEAPDEILFGNWQVDLRESGLLVQFEVGRTQVRLTEESLTWLTASGMVEPCQVAHILRALGSRKALVQLAEFIEPIVRPTDSRKSAPRNANDYMRCFTPLG